MKKLVVKIVMLAVAFASVSSIVSVNAKHLSPSAEDRAARKTYNKVWWAGVGAMGVSAAAQIFFNYKMQNAQKRVTELKNEIAAAELALASQNQDATSENTDENGQVVETEEEDTLESLREELAEEEAKLAKYKKYSLLCLVGVFGGLGVEFYANYKVTGNLLTNWREI